MASAPSPIRLNLYQEDPQKLHRDFCQILNAMGIDLSKVVIGGGTAIAAIEESRLSTDIDLFSHEPDFIIHLKACLGLRPASSSLALEERLSQVQGLFDVSCTEDGFKCKLSENRPVSLFRQPKLILPHLSDAVEKQTGMPIQRPSQILLGKMIARIINNRRIVLRDIYDIVWIRERNPAESRYMIEENLFPWLIRDFREKAMKIIQPEISKDPNWQGHESRPLLQIKDPTLVPPELWARFDEAAREFEMQAKRHQQMLLEKYLSDKPAEDVPAPKGKGSSRSTGTEKSDYPGIGD